MSELGGALRHRYGITALVLLAVPALYGAGELTRPSAAPAHPRDSAVPVQSAVVACQGVDGARVGVLSPRRGSGQTDVSVIPYRSALAGPAWPGTPWFQQPHGADTLAVRASGMAASGLEAEQTRLVKTGDERGLTGARCSEPGTDLWFLGPGPAGAKKIDVYLANVDAQPALADVQALSDVGPMVSAEGGGVAIEPYTSHMITIGQGAEGLAQIVDPAQVLALHVRVSTGRVAAAVRVLVDKGKGVGWEPMVGAPATDLVVPGIPGGQGSRQLLIAVPGEADAKVRLQVITAAGTAVPSAVPGDGAVSAPAQTVTAVPLEASLSGKPAAIRLTADRPILAGFTMDEGGGIAYGTAIPPLGAAGGVVADASPPGTTDSALLLTAPGAAATVRLTTVTAQGPAPNPQVVRVEAGRTLEVRLSAPPDSGLLIQPDAHSGPVYAARRLTADKLLTLLPIPPAATTITVPPVGESLTAVGP